MVCDTIRITHRYLGGVGEKAGLLQSASKAFSEKLFFQRAAFRVKNGIAVLDRTKEPAPGEPLISTM